MVDFSFSMHGVITMNEIQISKKSLIYRLMVKMNTINTRDIECGYIDSCYFTAAIINTLMLIILGCGVVLFLAVEVLRAIAEILMWAVVSLQFGHMIPMSDYAITVTTFLLVLCALSTPCIIYLVTSTIRRRMHRYPIKYYVFELYDAYKNKYCKKITFKEE